MNLLLLLLSLLFSHYSPSASCSDDTNQTGNTTSANDDGSGKGKTGKFGEGEYIIALDVHP